jgi:hypothetical protein
MIGTTPDTVWHLVGFRIRAVGGVLSTCTAMSRVSV